MFIKKAYLIAYFTLLILKSALAESSDQSYYIYDKLLHGTYSCIRDTVEPMNTECYVDRKYIHLSGWLRRGSEEIADDISDTTFFFAISAEFFLHSSTVEENHYLKECSRAMNLVKSNPNKWDLKIGINSSDILIYCEAVNQSLMQQYYSEQE
ncbi:MAG: hypothetical protein V7785_20260 [Bermanella sp.]